MLEAINTFLLLFISGVVFVHFVKVVTSKKKEKKTAPLSPRNESKGPQPITTHRLSEFLQILNEYSLYNNLRYKKIVDWFNWVKIFIDGEIYTPSVDEIQTDINQILKHFAKIINEAIRVDEEFMKNMSQIKLSEVEDSYSKEEIRNLVSQFRAQKAAIETTKKKFWTLHDTARDLGFETWGDAGYKIYIYLKPE